MYVCINMFVYVCIKYCITCPLCLKLLQVIKNRFFHYNNHFKLIQSGFAKFEVFGAKGAPLVYICMPLVPPICMVFNLF